MFIGWYYYATILIIPVIWGSNPFPTLIYPDKDLNNEGLFFSIGAGKYG